MNKFKILETLPDDRIPGLAGVHCRARLDSDVKIPGKYLWYSGVRPVFPVRSFRPTISHFGALQSPALVKLAQASGHAHLLITLTDALFLGSWR